MNIQNITALASQLKTIGFENMGYALLKRICLLPVSFTLNEKLLKDSGQVSFNFYFEKDVGLETYSLIYYDAALQKENDFAHIKIDGISISEIDEGMAQTDWKAVFDFSQQKSLAIDDKKNYEEELKIYHVISNLNKLESSAEGKSASALLKQKYWSEIPYNELMGSITNGRSKAEIGQRFYIAESQPVISAEEAYRFLLNRWMEKQMQSKKKAQDNIEETSAEESNTSAGIGLLKKRRIGNSKSNKKHNVSRD
ncbi:MAG: hypothetical protein J0H85_02880 [Sediminibacterium magnilacihabitans]|jgi:hypothetical protein|nr:hypothetical protein [Sediminibacterium magnilacihabitans]PQV62174.1 hypothetical protein CLV53_101449 [Sediminibacterium magnilacihabitans]